MVCDSFSLHSSGEPLVCSAQEPDKRVCGGRGDCLVRRSARGQGQAGGRAGRRWCGPGDRSRCRQKVKLDCSFGCWVLGGTVPSLIKNKPTAEFPDNDQAPHVSSE